MFITLYGINNIGKTTHTKRLVAKLNESGHEAIRIKYPVYDVSPSGNHLNRLLRSGETQSISEAELQLWFVLNRYQFQPTLEAHLSQGKIVVAEDYIGTGVAWGMTKGLDQSWLEAMNRGLFPSDLSILLDGSRALMAVESGHIHEENEILMKRCRDIHLQLAHDYGWSIVPVQPKKNQTFELIWTVVEKLMINDLMINDQASNSK